MKKEMQCGLRILMYVVVFCLIQVVFRLLVVAIYNFSHGEELWAMDANQFNVPLLVIHSALASVFTILLCVRLHWVEISPNYLVSRPWAVLWVVPLGIGCFIPLEYLMEHLPLSLPASQEQLFMALMSNRWGYLACGILAPVAEELLFRGAVIRALLKLYGREKYWMAIFVSALVFGAVHGNAAQFVPAFLNGLLFGWLYLRTGSLVPSTVLHMLNNTIVYVVSNLYPNVPNLKLDHFFGGRADLVGYAVLFSLCIAIPSLIQLNQRLRPASDNRGK